MAAREAGKGRGAAVSGLYAILDLAPTGRGGGGPRWHARLCTVAALSHPLWRSADGRISVVADACLLRRRELAAELRQELASEGVEELDGARLDGPQHADAVPEAALIAAAVRRWGEAAPGRLLGDFAFVAWDAAAGRLLAARDPAAARLLCWSLSDDAVHFASSPAALAAHPAVCDDLDPVAAAAFLSLDFFPSGRTSWSAVRKLRPGHRLSLALPGRGGAGGRPDPRHLDASWLREERWWRPEEMPPLNYRRDEEYAEHFGELLEAAVGDRLRRVAGTPAVFLSGGLDSSSVAAVAADLAARGEVAAAPFGVSHVFPSFEVCDEFRYASGLAAHWGLRLVAVDAERDLVPTAPHAELTRLEPALWAQRRFSAPLFRAAAEQGAGAVLTGLGGDALFDAARRGYGDDVRAGRWWRLAPWIADRRRRGATWPRALGAVLLKPLLPRAVAELLDLRLHPGSRRRVPPWVTPELVAALPSPGGALLGAGDVHLRGRARRTQWAHLVGLAQQAAAIEGLGACGAEHALPVLHPLLDRRLAEMVLTAPLHLGARPGAAGSKHLLRAALGGRLPAAVRRRDGKTGWGPYLAHLLRGPAGEAASALLRGGRLAERGWVDEVVLVGELERFRAGVGDGGRYGHGLAFLPPLLLELWLRARDETGGSAPGAEPADGGTSSLPIRHASPSASGLRRVR